MHLQPALLEWLGGPAAASRALCTAALVVLRILPLMAVAAAAGMGATPVALRVALGVVMAVALTPAALASAPLLPAHGALFLALGLRELLLGALFAMAVALPFYALRWAGELTDLWRGAELFQSRSGVAGSGSPLGSLYLMTAAAIFFSLGGHRVAIEAFATSFDSAAVGATAPVADLSQAALGSARLISRALALAAAFAAPAAAAIVLAELAFGLLGRVAPQMPLFFVAMPLRAALGLAAVLLTFSLVIPSLGPLFLEAIQTASRLGAGLPP